MPKCVGDVQNEWGPLEIKWSGLKEVEKTLETSHKFKTHALTITEVNECFSLTCVHQLEGTVHASCHGYKSFLGLKLY